MVAETTAQRFEPVALQHLDAAYNLARWLTGNDQDARDVVQDAYLRALKYFDGFDGENARRTDGARPAAIARVARDTGTQKGAYRGLPSRPSHLDGFS